MEDLIAKIKREIDEKDSEIKTLKERINFLQEALLKKEGVPNGDVRISRRDLFELWEKCTEDDENGNFRYEDLVYGKDVTVHWNGFYCDCYDGATAYNNIISALPGLDDEVGGHEPDDT